MKKPLIYLLIGFFIALYFVLILLVLPEQYLSNDILVPQPYFSAELSKSEISLGDSFRIDILSENIGDYGDIHIVSVAFPGLIELGDTVKIFNYNFTQSPVYFATDDEIASGYSAGLQSTLSQYPSVEAMNRPVYPDTKNHFELLITPEKTGNFIIYVKSINIPHIDSRSHYPYSGILDHQNEYVLEYSVNVNP